MAAIDEGAPIRIVMEDIAFGQDQVFYQDAINGSVLVAMEDGFDDGDETLDSYLIPVWDPSDTVQDVIKRYFPVTEDEDGDLLAIDTPEFDTTPARFVEHALTGTSWWNIYLSDGLDYAGEFKSTLASPNTTILVRIVSDNDLDGYNNRNEIRLGTNPDDPASHPGPVLLAGYSSECTGDDCVLRMVFQNLGNYDAYGVEAVLYSPDGLADITNNTIGGSGRVPAGERVVVGESDTFQYTRLDPAALDPVIVVSYNDPQGNHRFVLPALAALGVWRLDVVRVPAVHPAGGDFVAQDHFRALMVVTVNVSLIAPVPVHPLERPRFAFQPDRVIASRLFSFLQKQDVGNDLCSRIGLKSRAGQSDRSQQLHTLCQPAAHLRLLLVQGVAAGDKRHDAARPQQGDRIGEEEIVDACSQEAGEFLRTVPDAKVTEGYIGDHHIKPTLWQIGFLVPLGVYMAAGVQ